MDSVSAVEALSALAQPTRLRVFQELVRHEPDGLIAGDVARLIDTPQNTMSSHLAVLSRARLVTSERRGRQIVYRASLEGLRQLTVFLVKDCCEGRAEICAPLLAELTCC